MSELDIEYLKKLITFCSDHALTCEIFFNPSETNLMQIRVESSYLINKAFIDGKFKLQKEYSFISKCVDEVEYFFNALYEDY